MNTTKLFDDTTQEQPDAARLETVFDETNQNNNNNNDNMENEVSFNKSSSSFSSLWSTWIQKIFHKPILNVITTIACKAATNPKTTITSVIALSFAILITGLFTNFNTNYQDTIWSPIRSRPLQHKDWIENESGFPREPRYFIINIHRNGDNIFDEYTTEAVENAFEVAQVVQKTEGFNELCFNRTEDYLPSTPCFISSIANFWSTTADVTAIQDLTQQELLETMTTSILVTGSPVDLEDIIGNPQYDTETGILNYAQMLQITIPLPALDNEETYDFEEVLLDEIFELRDYYANHKLNRIEVFAERSFEDEFARAIVSDIPLLPIAFTVMSTFTCLVFFKYDQVKSQTLLGFGAVVCVLLSIMTGYGLLFIIGVPFTSMTQVLPFIMFGIGLDDAFIISGSFLRTDRNKNIVERVEETMKDAAVSITLTTVTSSAAFGFGATSSIPSVFWLCWYAFPTVIIDFLYQITFFVAILALDEKRIQENRRDCCICMTVTKDDDANDDDNGDNTSRTDNEKQQQQQSTVVLSSSSPSKEAFATSVPENGDEEKPSTAQPRQESTDDVTSSSASSTEHTMVDRFMIWYGQQLVKPFVKAFVLLFFSALLACCAISSTKLTQEFRFVDVVPDDSYVKGFWTVYNGYVNRGSLSAYIYFRNVNQSDPSIQLAMNNYVDDLLAMDQVNGTEPPFFWLSDFESFMANQSSLISDPIQAFLSDPIYQSLYQDEIVLSFNDETNQTEIVASRCLLYLPNVDEDLVTDNIAALKSQRRVTKNQEINNGRSDWAFFTYDSLYNIWSFYAVAVEELTFSTILGVGAVSFIALIGIPHWSAIFFVMPLISILYIDLLGVLQFAGLHINAVSYVSVVMSIGLLVDFIMHVLIRYYEIPNKSRDVKIQEMLRTMGSSVLIGGISTFLGVIPLAFSSSQIFNTLFVTFLGLVTLGVGHGLVLLPVVLSMIGPTDSIVALRHESKN